MGRHTLLAIRTFQQLQNLPETGQLDDATTTAIQAACTQSQDDGADAQDAVADQSPDSSSDGGSTGAGADDGELSFPTSEPKRAGEYLLSGPISIEVKTMPKLKLEDDLSTLPSSPGLYVTYVNGEPWHVGAAQESIRRNVCNQVKALRNMNVPKMILQSRSVEPIPLVRASVGSNALSHNVPGRPPQPLNGPNAILKIVEQLYERRLKTDGKGNEKREQVRVVPGATFSLIVDSKQHGPYAGPMLI